jgi:hypothetical protein
MTWLILDDFWLILEVLLVDWSGLMVLGCFWSCWLGLRRQINDDFYMIFG